MINTTLTNLIKLALLTAALTASTQADICKVLIDGYKTAIKTGITPSATLTHQAKSCMTTGKPATPTYGAIERETKAKSGFDKMSPTK